MNAEDSPALSATEPTTEPTVARTPADAVLREPANRVSPRAVGYWRTNALLWEALWLIGLAVGYWFLPDKWWWATALLVALVILSVLHVAFMPTIRYRIHRWEVTEQAIHTREGWLTRESRIAPINRVQTVDFTQGALMRPFKLASLTVTTASAAGPITISGLDHDEAKRLAATLTEITSADEGDAT